MEDTRVLAVPTRRRGGGFEEKGKVRNVFLGGGRQRSRKTSKKLQSPIEYPWEVSDHAIRMKQVNIVCFNLL